MNMHKLVLDLNTTNNTSMWQLFVLDKNLQHHKWYQLNLLVKQICICWRISFSEYLRIVWYAFIAIITNTAIRIQGDSLPSRLGL